MGAQAEFTVFAEEVLDEDLTLLLAKGEGLPRLGIFNTGNNKKKYVPLSWVEGGERNLKIRVGKETKEYPMSQVVGGVGSLIRKAGETMGLNALTWHGVQLLGDMVHIPQVARSEIDLTLIDERKRDTLWYLYTPRGAEWRVRPCFVEADAEREVYAQNLEQGAPWPGFAVRETGIPATMRNMSFARAFAAKNPRRWTEFLLPLSKAMLLGFSDWSPGSEHAFGEALWKYLPRPDYRSTDSLNALLGYARFFLARLISYLRHWPLLDKLALESHLDGEAAAAERGMKKKERFEMIVPSLGEKRFKVTKYTDDADNVAFSVEPSTRLPGELDQLLAAPGEVWQRCCDACSLGGELDSHYTCSSVISAIETKEWYARIHHCLCEN